MYKQGTLIKNTISNMVGRIVAIKETEIGRLDYYEIEFFTKNILTQSYNDLEVRKLKIFFNEFDMLVGKDIIKIIDLDLKVGDKFINTMNGTVATIVDLETFNNITEPLYVLKSTETEFDSFGYQPGKVNTKTVKYLKWKIEEKIMKGFIVKVSDEDAHKWKYINDLRG